MLCVLALLSVVLCSSFAQDAVLSSRYDNYLLLDSSPRYELYWSASGNSIAFAVRVATGGWIGFGISPNGLMLDSDVIQGFVDDTSNTPTITDRRTDPNVRVAPTTDALQNWNTVAGSQADGFTTLEFSRLVDTGDTVGDRVIGQETNLIWAVSTADDINTAHSGTTVGSRLGVNLLVTPPTTPPPNPTPPTDGPTSPPDGPTSPPDGPTSPPDGPTSPPDGPTSPPDGPTSPPDGPTSPPDGPTSPPDGPTSPPDGPTSPPDGPTSPPDGPTSPPDGPTSPPDGPTSPPDGPTSPPDGPTSPPDGPTSPPDGPTSPPDGPTSPPDGPTSPPDGPTSPPDGPTSPPDGPTSPPDGPTSPPDGPTSPPDGPTSPPDGPTSPPDGPTSPPDGPTPPSCDPEPICCEGRVFDEASCSCVCENVQECSDGYVFDPKSCQCVCEGRISEEVWYERVRECSRDYHKIFSIFSCGCECSKHIQCGRNLVVDPKTCRCVCPPSSCTSPKVMNHYSCECQCPHRYCHQGYTFDHDTCQCKCSRTCRDHEVLDSRYCQCRRKPVTHPPTRRITYPSTRPTVTHPPHRSTHCTHLSTQHSCYNRHNWNGVPCQWIKGRCQPLCCKPRHGYRPPHYGCASYSEVDCKRRASCHWYC